MKDFKLPRQPFFKPGSARFYGSKHILIKDGKYYRCGKASNQFCKTHDRRILAESVERNFSRLAKKMHRDKLDLNNTCKKVMKENLVDLIFEVEEKTEEKDVLANATLSAMKEDVAEGRKSKRSDQKDYLENYMNTMRVEHPVMLFGITIGMIRMIASDLPEAEMGRSLALLSKNIYITDRGQIESIELERWAWYSLHAIAKHEQIDLNEMAHDLKISNGPDPICELGITDAAQRFDTEDMPEAMNENFLVPVTIMKFMKDCLENIFSEGTEEMNEKNIELFHKFQNDPLLKVVFGMVSMFPNKK